MNGLETEYQGQLNILRINIQSAEGSELAKRFDSRLTPTFIFLDEHGKELWREFGTIDAEHVQKTLAP